MFVWGDDTCSHTESGRPAYQHAVDFIEDFSRRGRLCCWSSLTGFWSNKASHPSTPVSHFPSHILYIQFFSFGGVQWNSRSPSTAHRILTNALSERLGMDHHLLPLSIGSLIYWCRLWFFVPVPIFFSHWGGLLTKLPRVYGWVMEEADSEQKLWQAWNQHLSESDKFWCQTVTVFFKLVISLVFKVVNGRLKDIFEESVHSKNGFCAVVCVSALGSFWLKAISCFVFPDFFFIPEVLCCSHWMQFACLTRVGLLSFVANSLLDDCPKIYL